MRIKRNKKWLPKLSISERINSYHVVNGILTHYNIQYDPYLCIGRCYIIRMTYYCIEFSNTMNLPWETYLVPKHKSRYSSVTKLKYYQILGNHNYWVIMN